MLVGAAAMRPLLSGDDVVRVDLINQVNSAKVGWTAGLNSRFAGSSFNATRSLLGVKFHADPARRLPVKRVAAAATLPTSFDSRTQWSNCKYIGEIRDQSSCGSCWAHGCVEAATDRICIGTSGASQPHLSVQDLNSNCGQCGDGCGGGDPGSAWEYLTTNGVVTGGNYGDESWCAMYSLPQCDHHTTGKYPPCPSTEYNTPPPFSSCDANSTYTTPYANDLHVFATAYSVNPDANSIATEIMTNGPVEAAFDVYADFESYKSGVYQHVTGDYLGGHAVKILGWGVDAASNLPYWLVANSWNTDWGEKGFFRILRGSDECGIEDNIVAGLYKN